MSLRSVALAAVIGVLIINQLHTYLFPILDENARFWYSAVTRTTMLAMVAICAALAAHTFGWWSEYVGRAWTLFFIEYTLLTASEILLRTQPEALLVNGIAVVIANVAGVGAYILMARSLEAAGLGDYETRTKKIAAGAIAILVATLLCYGPILSAFEVVRYDTSAVGGLISPLADAITFVLVAPLLLTVIALRGGKLFWIYALLTAGTVGWMVNQGSGMILPSFHSDEITIGISRMTGFAMACFLIAAAALTQWLTARAASSEV